MILKKRLKLANEQYGLVRKLSKELNLDFNDIGRALIEMGLSTLLFSTQDSKKQLEFFETYNKDKQFKKIAQFVKDNW